MPAPRCIHCYALDEDGYVKRFLCSPLGWVDGLKPCPCKHHAEAPFLFELLGGKA